MKQAVLIVYAIISFFEFSIPPKIEKIIDKEIASVFSIEIFQKEVVVIDKDIINILPADFSEENFHNIIQDNNVIGYFYYGNALGKLDTFDFVVIYDQDLIIKKIKVVAYREDYGGEIGSNRWLKQFINLTKEDSVTYGKEIKAISGATISASALTLAVNNILKSIEILKNKNLI